MASAGYGNGLKIKLDSPLIIQETQSLFLLVQSQLRDVGVDVELNLSSDTAAILDRWYGRTQRANIQGSSLQNSPAMDADFALTWFRGTMAEPERRYNNPEFDRLYGQSLTEVDEAKRADLLRQTMAVMYEDPPFLFLVDGFTLWASRPGLSGVQARTDQEPRLDVIRSS